MAASPRTSSADTPQVRHDGTACVVLAAGAYAEACRAALVDAGFAVSVVSDPLDLAGGLARARPSVAVVVDPPAGERELRVIALERRRRRRLRAIFVSVDTDPAARLRALELGFDEALPSSVGPRELAGRVSLLVNEAGATRWARPAGRLPVTDTAELDLIAHELRDQGRPVHLRPKEFALLAFFARHPGRLFTRGKLLERVWGADAVSGPRTVDVHVRWLRSKIEPDPGRPVHLVTVRGAGYRFDGPER